jgi:hypothetical protein
LRPNAARETSSEQSADALKEMDLRTSDLEDHFCEEKVEGEEEEKVWGD